MLFRYPGGKGRLSKHILPKIPFGTAYYAEPFVGGGAIALAVATQCAGGVFPIDGLWLNDLDYWISSFWGIVSGDNQNDFCSLVKLVEETPITLPTFFSRREAHDPDTFPRKDINAVDAAFNALFFNRTTFSGILTSGPIGGDQTGEYKVNVRWNSQRLCAELYSARAALRACHTRVFNLPFESFIATCPKSFFLYLDPPYVDAGDSLYSAKVDDHTVLRDLLAQRNNWLLSYDNDKKGMVRTWYPDDSFDVLVLNHYRSMSGALKAGKTRPRDKSELLITPK